MCRRLLRAEDPIVDLVELIPAGSTDGVADYLDGHHDFAHARCLAPGTQLYQLREVSRGHTLDEALRRSGDRP